MGEIAISDTGPILHLFEIQQGAHLNIFEQLNISQYVKKELEYQNIFEETKKVLGKRLHIRNVSKGEIELQSAKHSASKLHTTDLSVAALAEKFSPSIVLTDDLNLRKSLEQRGTNVTGSIGVLFRAFSMERTSKNELEKNIEQIFNGSTLYLSKGFREKVSKILDDL